MKTYGCSAFLILASMLCSAQNSATYRACSRQANAQREMNVCANEESVRVDHELNQIYELLLSKARGRPLAIAKVQAAQMAWITYRDAYIEAMYPATDKQGAYGSVFPMEVDLLSAKLARQQINALHDILRQNEPR